METLCSLLKISSTKSNIAKKKRFLLFENIFLSKKKIILKLKNEIEAIDGTTLKKCMHFYNAIFYRSHGLGHDVNFLLAKHYRDRTRIDTLSHKLFSCVGLPPSLLKIATEMHQTAKYQKSASGIDTNTHTHRRESLHVNYFKTFLLSTAPRCEVVWLSFNILVNEKRC